MKNHLRLCLITIWVSLLPSSVFAIGTYAEGSLVGTIVQFESRGIIFESYEGLMEITKYEKDEKCDQLKDECFSPKVSKIEFSVRLSNSELVNFIRNNMNKELLIGYNIHQIKSISLSSDMEIIAAAKQESSALSTQGEKLIVNKSGGKRNFSVTGKILQLDYQGFLIGTYEGGYITTGPGLMIGFVIGGRLLPGQEAHIKSFKIGTGLGDFTSTRYWVGNSGLWTDTDHWSATSGGAGGESVPDDEDDVIIDSNSFTEPGHYIEFSV